MTLPEIIQRIDEQMAAERNKKSNDRRTQNVPVDVERRKRDRRGPPNRDDFKDSYAYNRAYDRWAENQR